MIFLGQVIEGNKYGPLDHICKKKVEFQRKCGHKTQMDCHSAFEQVLHGGSCSENVTITNPECGHNATVPCSQKQQLENKGLLTPTPSTIIL